MKVAQKSDPLLVRLMRRIQFSADGCWPWMGSLSGTGYGQIRVNYKLLVAHRLSYELSTGTKPTAELHVHHRCGNRLCVRPSHLELLSRPAHSQKHAPARIKPLCPRGHLKITGKNGELRCPQCVAGQAKAWRKDPANREAIRGYWRNDKRQKRARLRRQMAIGQAVESGWQAEERLEALRKQGAA